MGIESQNTSTRPSLISGGGPCEQDGADSQQLMITVPEGHRLSQDREKSFIDEGILKHLQRELNQEVIDAEFNPKVSKSIYITIYNKNMNKIRTLG